MAMLDRRNFNDLTLNNYSKKIKKSNYSSSTSNSSNSQDGTRKNYFNCKHDFEYLNKFYCHFGQNEDQSGRIFIEKIVFCIYCRGLLVETSDKGSFYTVSNLKSETMNDHMNPIIMYFQMRKNDIKTNLSFINDYDKKRRNMISFLSKLKNKYKISDDSFFLAITLLDNVSSKLIRFDIDVELLTIGCFFLAGKYLENDSYMGDFQNLCSNFKKIFYTSEDMQKSEIFCLKLLNFNISIITAKQYYDIFCLTGFLFEDELNIIKDIKEFYESGVKILKELVTDFQSTYFTNVALAFSVVVYLREFHYLETKHERIPLLEKILKIKRSSYFGAWNLLKKVKHFHPNSTIDSSTLLEKNVNKGQISEEGKTNIISPNLKISNKPIDKLKLVISPLSIVAKKNSDNTLSSNISHLTINADIDNPNSINFRSSIKRERKFNTMKDKEGYNKVNQDEENETFKNDAKEIDYEIDDNNYEKNILRSNLENEKKNFIKMKKEHDGNPLLNSNNKAFLRSTSLIKDNFKSTTLNGVTKKIDFDLLSSSSKDSDSNVINLIYNTNHMKGKNKPVIVNKKIKIKNYNPNKINNYNENELLLENDQKVEKQDIINKINHQLKSITSNKLIRINSIGLGLSGSSISTGIISSGNTINEQVKMFDVNNNKKNTNYLDGKLDNNPNANLNSYTGKSINNFNMSYNNNNFAYSQKKQLADPNTGNERRFEVRESIEEINKNFENEHAAPKRKSRKIVDEMSENKANEYLKIFYSKRQSVDRLPIANLTTKKIELLAPNKY